MAEKQPRIQPLAKPWLEGWCVHKSPGILLSWDKQKHKYQGQIQCLLLALETQTSKWKHPRWERRTAGRFLFPWTRIFVDHKYVAEDCVCFIWESVLSNGLSMGPRVLAHELPWVIHFPFQSCSASGCKMDLLAISFRKLVWGFVCNSVLFSFCGVGGCLASDCTEDRSALGAARESTFHPLGPELSL